MKQITEEEFYKVLWAETKDVIHGRCTHHRGNFYPYTRQFIYRNTGNIFGAVKNLGYINGVPVSEYYLNN